MTAIITPIIMPFANGRQTGTLPNVQPSTTPATPDIVANQFSGFPYLQSQPLGTPNATPVNEAEMNGTLYFYTNLLFQQGQGYQYTFDATLSSTVSGYPQGAVLWCASNNTYQISLINNNTANFVTTPSYINDGVNWQTVVQPYMPDITDIAGNVTIGNVSPNYTNIMQSKDINNHISRFQTYITVVGPSTVATNFAGIIESDGTTPNVGLATRYGIAPFYSGNSSALSTRNGFSVAYISDTPTVYNGSGYYGYQYTSIANKLSAVSFIVQFISGTTTRTWVCPISIFTNSVFTESATVTSGTPNIALYYYVTTGVGSGAPFGTITLNNPADTQTYVTITLLGF